MTNLATMIRKVDTLVAVKRNQLYYKFAKSEVECNICNYKAGKLASDAWHMFTRCPTCGSSVRLRLLKAMLEHSEEFSLAKVLSGKRVLHFAPEKKLGGWIRENAGLYKTADFLTEGYTYEQIDYNIDISAMPSISSSTFDCVIACDVLEHVPDHIGGMREVYRVLRKGGHCIFTVPQQDNLALTFEDLSDLTHAQRKTIFGQFDHLRIYGDDFSSMLESCGFEVSVFNENSFSKEIAERNVLYPPILSNSENVTNYRKVFIGVKK